jgi:hypothetical protein
VALVTSISKVLVDLGLDPICGIPHVSNKAWLVLEVMGSILEHLRAVPASALWPSLTR